MSAVLEDVAGVALEAVVFGIAAGVLYKFWKQMSFLPQRKLLLPFNRGVLLDGERVVKVVEPGRYWVKPRQTLVAVDIRSRPFQMEARELLTADGQGIRVRFNGSYKVIDPALFLSESNDGKAALYLSLEREIGHAIGELNRDDLVYGNVSPVDRVKERIEPRAAQLGMTVTHLEVSDLLPISWVHQPFER